MIKRTYMYSIKYNWNNLTNKHWLLWQSKHQAGIIDAADMAKFLIEDYNREYMGQDKELLMTSGIKAYLKREGML